MKDEFKFCEYNPPLIIPVVGKKEDVVKEKIAFKFPMSKTVMTVSGRFFTYSVIEKGLIFTLMGSVYINKE